LKLLIDKRTARSGAGFHGRESQGERVFGPRKTRGKERLSLTTKKKEEKTATRQDRKVESTRGEKKLLRDELSGKKREASQWSAKYSNEKGVRN